MEHDGDTVRDFFQFVEVLADDQHRRAAGGKIDQGLADDRRGAGIDTPGRLADDKNMRLAQDLTADNELCRLPPESVTASGSRLALRTSKDFGRAIDVSERRRLVDETFFDHAARGVAGQQSVLGQLHAWRGTVTEPLLRHKRGAHAAAFGDIEPAGSLTVDDDGSFAPGASRSPDSAENNSS